MAVILDTVTKQGHVDEPGERRDELNSSSNIVTFALCG